MIVFIIFGAMGVVLFGGKINSFAINLYNEEFDTSYDYEHINFNNFINSVIFFFIVIFNNDWPILVNLCLIKDGDKAKHTLKFVFIVFKFIVNFIFINSIIAFVIEIFYEYEKSLKERRTTIFETNRGKESIDEIDNIIKEDIFERLNE